MIQRRRTHRRQRRQRQRQRQRHPGVGAALSGLLLFAAFAGAPSVQAERAAPAGAVALDGFIARAAKPCQAGPATACIDLAWAFADRNGDRTLDLAEMRALRATVAGWAEWKGAALPEQTRAGLALALWTVDAVGLDKMVAAYDANGDGRLNRAEALADLRLDDRPLRVLLADPAALDRAALQRRLNALLPRPTPLPAPAPAPAGR